MFALCPGLFYVILYRNRVGTIMALPSSLDWADKVSMVVSFAEPLGTLKSEHIGLFWHRVRREYPKVEQTPPHPRVLSQERLLSSTSRG